MFNNGKVINVFGHCYCGKLTKFNEITPLKSTSDLELIFLKDPCIENFPRTKDNYSMSYDAKYKAASNSGMTSKYMNCGNL